MPRIATKTVGHLKVCRALRTHGQGVVSTSRADKVAAVSARDTRYAALRSPRGANIIAGSAILPVNNSTGVQTQLASLPMSTRERQPSAHATANRAPITAR